MIDQAKNLCVMKREPLEYYLCQNYRTIVQKESLEDESWYIAYCTEFGKYACYGQGDTPEEAISSFNVEKEVFVELLYDNGKPIPLPIKEEEVNNCSGIFNVRTTPEIHSLLLFQAEKFGISLNKYVNTIISHNTGLANSSIFVNERLEAIERKLDTHHLFVCNKLKYSFSEPDNKKALKLTDEFMYANESTYFNVVPQA